MRKHDIIFPALFLTLSTMPCGSFALTVSGTVKDDMGPLSGASVQTINSDGKVQNAKVTDINGRFTIDVTENAKLQISFMGLKTQTIDNPKENLDITLVEETKSALDKDVIVVKEHQEGDPCGAVLIKDEFANKGAKGKYKKVNNEWICVPNECIQDYIVEENVCVKYQCSKEDLNIANAKNGAWDKSTQKCIPTCDEDGGYTKSLQNICEKTNCSKSEIANLKKDKNVDTGKIEAGQCVPVCKNKYHLDGGKCVKNQCDNAEEDWNGKECVKARCTPDELATLNASDGKWENNQCIPTKCKDEKNFKLENGICGANDCPTKELKKINATSGYMQDGKCIINICKENYSLENGACVSKKVLEEKQKAYDEAKATEQSTENKTLTALTTAATGIGGMQLMQGMAEQSSDDDAVADMTAYIETMRCTYGDGQQVKAGPDEIELPGANDQELMNLRGEYLALAADLKERKTALGMKPGIESETIMDRASTGLYDDENIGITSGNYASLYRAMMLGSESDQSKISDEQSTSSNRVKYGAIAAGAGAVVGVVGNSLINGKLGEMLKSKKSKSETEKLLEKEADALKDLQKCLKSAGIQDTDKLEFANFYPSVLNVKNIKCKNIKLKDGKKANEIKSSEIFVDSNDGTEIFNSMNKYFDMETISKMVGLTKTETEDNIKEKIKSSISEKQKKMDEAKAKDSESEKTNSKDSKKDNSLSNVDISNFAEQTSGLLSNSNPLQ